MAKIRGSFQGVINVARFNWHFYLLAGVLALSVLTAGNYFNLPFLYAYAACLLVIIPVLVSLFVTYYVYDRSDLYKFDWLDDLDISRTGRFLNINAGFDETSSLLSAKYPPQRCMRSISTMPENIPKSLSNGQERRTGTSATRPGSARQICRCMTILLIIFL